MIIDCASLTDHTTIGVDICVIGAGPAGLAFASAFLDSAVSVAVIEAGGQPGGPLGLDAPAATAVDSDFGAPLAVPNRFGGAANEWMVRLPRMRRGVRMLPLSPEDLEAHEWLPHSGWPLDWEELQPWYERAAGFLGLSQRGFSLENWTDDDHRPIDLEAFGLTTAIEQMADPRLFTHTIHERMQHSTNVDVYLGAAAGSLDGSVDMATTLMIDHGRRDRIAVRATTFVIACGGIENARLLLEARGEQGFGASVENVGAYYVDHHRCIAGSIRPADPRVFDDAAIYDLTSRHDAHVMGKIVPCASTRRDHDLLHSGTMLLPKPSIDSLDGLADFRRFVRAPWRGLNKPGRALRSTAALGQMGVDMALAQRRFPPHVDAGWSGLRGRTTFESFMVETQVELTPDPANRVTLSATANEFGRRRAEIRWRWTDTDLKSLRRTTELLADAFADCGVGTLTPSQWQGHPEVTTPNGAFHPSGTTRMSHTPSDGVVDRDGLVHGSSNVYVLGSSTFPTVGYANPTLTVVALARRLAVHLTASAADR